MSLKQKALKSIKWTAISSITGSIVQLLQLIILTHFLSPLDFGLFALAWVVIAFSQMFIDMGVSNAIIYKQDITKLQLDTLYWLNIFSGLSVFILLFFVAPAIGNFYREPRIIMIIRWISLSFIIQPFEQQFLILLKKDLAFNEIAKREIVSKIISLIVAVALAIYGLGVFALVFAQLAAVVVSSILMIYIGLKYHRPGFNFNFSSIKEIFKFGLYQVGENFLNYFNSQCDTILIGKFLGVEAVGIYNIAKSIAMRPAQIINPIVTQIAFPIMAMLQQNIVHLKNTYLKTINVLSSINFPVYFFIAFFAEPIILIFFGEKWHSAILTLRILSLYGMIRSTGNPVGSLILAIGRADLGFHWNLGLFFLIPVTLYLGSFYGLNGTALTLLGLQLILLIPAWKLLINKCCNAGFIEYFKQMLIPLSISCLQGIIYMVIILCISSKKMQLASGVCTMVVTTFYLNKLFNKENFLLLMHFLHLDKKRTLLHN